MLMPSLRRRWVAVGFDCAVAGLLAVLVFVVVAGAVAGLLAVLVFVVVIGGRVALQQCGQPLQSTGGKKNSPRISICLYGVNL